MSSVSRSSAPSRRAGGGSGGSGSVREELVEARRQREDRRLRRLDRRPRQRAGRDALGVERGPPPRVRPQPAAERCPLLVARAEQPACARDRPAREPPAPARAELQQPEGVAGPHHRQPPGRVHPRPRREPVEAQERRRVRHPRLEVAPGRLPPPQVGSRQRYDIEDGHRATQDRGLAGRSGSHPRGRARLAPAAVHDGAPEAADADGRPGGPGHRRAPARGAGVGAHDDRDRLPGAADPGGVRRRQRLRRPHRLRREDEPLGTVGALRQIEGLDEHVPGAERRRAHRRSTIRELVRAHREAAQRRRSPATRRTVQIADYGVMHFDADGDGPTRAARLRREADDQPTRSSMGVYVLRAARARAHPAERAVRLPRPDPARCSPPASRSGRCCTTATGCDIGRHDDYEQARPSSRTCCDGCCPAQR